MSTFVSDISKKKYPVAEKVDGGSIRPAIMDIILRDHPEFDSTCSLAASELNEYRGKYIASLRTGEAAELRDLEQKVIESFQEGDSLVDKVEEVQSDTRFGERLADKVASFGGSWLFVISFISFLTLWVMLNIILPGNSRPDPYPFILLNLCLSFIAALQAPVIMMSQNRQEDKDRDRAKKDYMINLKAELEVRLLHEKMNHLMLKQQAELIEMQEIQIEIMNDILSRMNSNTKGMA